MAGAVAHSKGDADRRSTNAPAYIGGNVGVANPHGRASRVSGGRPVAVAVSPRTPAGADKPARRQGVAVSTPGPPNGFAPSQCRP